MSLFTLFSLSKLTISVPTPHQTLSGPRRCNPSRQKSWVWIFLLHYRRLSCGWVRYLSSWWTCELLFLLKKCTLLNLLLSVAMVPKSHLLLTKELDVDLHAPRIPTVMA